MYQILFKCMEAIFRKEQEKREGNGSSGFQLIHQFTIVDYLDRFKLSTQSAKMVLQEEESNKTSTFTSLPSSVVFFAWPKLNCQFHILVNYLQLGLHLNL